VRQQVSNSTMILKNVGMHLYPIMEFRIKKDLHNDKEKWAKAYLRGYFFTGW